MEDELLLDLEYRLADSGSAILDVREFMDVNARARRTPGLRSVLRKLERKIDSYDPLWFRRNELFIPEDPEVALFELYYPEHGMKGVERVVKEALACFEKIPVYIFSGTGDTKEVVDTLRTCFDGTYFGNGI